MALKRSGPSIAIACFIQLDLALFLEASSPGVYVQHFDVLPHENPGLPSELQLVIGIINHPPTKLYKSLFG